MELIFNLLWVERRSLTPGMERSDRPNSTRSGITRLLSIFPHSSLDSAAEGGYRARTRSSSAAAMNERFRRMLWQREVHYYEDNGRVLHVALPEGYRSRGEPYPVLVCLDAQWTFGTVCDVALNLGLARLLPRVIVIGVGWSSTIAKEVVHSRAVSYTPTSALIPASVARNMAGATVFSAVRLSSSAGCSRAPHRGGTIVSSLTSRNATGHMGHRPKAGCSSR